MESNMLDTLPPSIGQKEDTLTLLWAGQNRLVSVPATIGTPPPEQWPQRHPEAGSSWPNWPQASHSTPPVTLESHKNGRPSSSLTLLWAGQNRLVSVPATIGAPTPPL